MKPAVRIYFAPLLHRVKHIRDRGAMIVGESAQRTIWIDPRDKSIGRTLLHELIHRNHPSWTEQRVIYEERKRWAKMTWKAKARLLQLFGSAKIEGEE